MYGSKSGRTIVSKSYLFAAYTEAKAASQFE